MESDPPGELLEFLHWWSGNVFTFLSYYYFSKLGNEQEKKQIDAENLFG